MSDELSAAPLERPRSGAEAENTFIQPRPGPKRWPVLLFLAALVLVPAIFWRQVWWGSTLSDEQLEKQLTQSENIRHVQHALEQLSRRIQSSPDTARPFYPKVIVLAEHGEPLVRAAAAWLMGEDNACEPFHQQLQRLLADAHPAVRYNAATALTRFGDGSGREVLRAMLRSYPIAAAWEGSASEGVVRDILHADDPVNPLTQLALIDRGGDGLASVLAPLGGRLVQVQVTDGQRIRRGDTLASIAPNADQIWAALRALYLVGGTEDLEDVERYFNLPPRFPAQIAQQARATAAAIRRRGGAG